MTCTTWNLIWMFPQWSNLLQITRVFSLRLGFFLLNIFLCFFKETLTCTCIKNKYLHMIYSHIFILTLPIYSRFYQILDFSLLLLNPYLNSLSSCAFSVFQFRHFFFSISSYWPLQSKCFSHAATFSTILLCLPS